MLDKLLLDRFLRNECNAEERRAVLDYLTAYPDEAANCLTEREFEDIQPEVWDPRRSARSFQEIQQRLTPRTIRLMRWSLAAAAVLVVVIGIKWLNTGKPAPQGRALAAIDSWETQANHSPRTLMVLLPDGSSAELSPGSQISYRRTFTTDARRIVKLSGEGQFNVSGDPGRPFAVVSSELTTTVLGTWFSVTADPGAPVIKVHLYTGKIKVGMTGGTHWKTKDSAFYLQPGEELTYDKQKMLAVVRSPQHLGNPNVLARNMGPRTTRSHQLTASSKPEWYAFGAQPLTEVFDQLSDYYGVQINYFPSDVENHYFTGKFSRSDSLEDILNDIALLHGLTLTKKEGLYVFRKKDQ